MESTGAERTIRPQGEVCATPDPRLGEFYFDFIDPGSYVVSHLIDRTGTEESFNWFGLELRPPPAPMIDSRASAWRSRHAEALLLAQPLGLSMSEPGLLPWTRKAHELCEFSRDRDRFHQVRRALFRAHFVDRIDIGRIDLLTELAHEAGLDRSETRAALDVDRYAEAIASTRESALDREIRVVPTLVTASRRLADTGSLREIQQLLAGGMANGE